KVTPLFSYQAIARLWRQIVSCHARGSRFPLCLYFCCHSAADGVPGQLAGWGRKRRVFALSTSNHQLSTFLKADTQPRYECRHTPTCDHASSCGHTAARDTET